MVYKLIEWEYLRAVKAGKNVQVEKNSLDEFRASGKVV